MVWGSTCRIYYVVQSENTETMWIKNTVKLWNKANNCTCCSLKAFRLHICCFPFCSYEIKKFNFVLCFDFVIIQGLIWFGTKLPSRTYHQQSKYKLWQLNFPINISSFLNLNLRHYGFLSNLYHNTAHLGTQYLLWIAL